VIEEADPAFSKADWMRITAFACSARMAPALFLFVMSEVVNTAAMVASLC
jgi:hypothetical protein